MYGRNPVHETFCGVGQYLYNNNITKEIGKDPGLLLHYLVL